MDNRVAEVKERRQRQSLLELDRHGMELRPLTQAFVTLAKRNSNWWADGTTTTNTEAQSGLGKRSNISPVHHNTPSSQRQLTSHKSTALTPKSNPVMITPEESIAFAHDGTRSESSLSAATNRSSLRRPQSAGSSYKTSAAGSQSLSTMQSQWNQNYGSKHSSLRMKFQRPTSANGLGSPLLSPSHGTPPVAATSAFGSASPSHPTIRKSVNPAFDAKTADAIQMGLALAQRQKSLFDQANKKDPSSWGRRGCSNDAKQSSLTTTVLEVNNKMIDSNMHQSHMRPRTASSAAASSAVDPSESHFPKSTQNTFGDPTAAVDPFKEAPIPSLVDDPTEWLRKWQRKTDEKKRFSKDATVLGKHALAQRRRLETFGEKNGNQAADDYERRSSGQPGHHSADLIPSSLSIGADMTIPDTIVWENNIPKGWFYYDKKERLVCKRKVDTKAVQLALLDGAQYENDPVAVLYMMGQSTLGGSSTSAAAKKGGGTWYSNENKSTKNSSGESISSKARRYSAASTTATSKRRDSLMTSTLSEAGGQSLSGGGRRSSDIIQDEEDDDDENEASKEERLAHIKKLKQQRFLSRAATDLTEDIQSRVLHCRFITAAELPSFLYDVGGKFREKGTCILQKFVYSIDVAHLDIFQAVWTPQVTHVTRRQNINNLFDERIPVFQRCTTIEGSGAEYYSQSVQITTRTQNQIKAACDGLAAHFQDTNPKFHLTRMICHFRLAGTLQHEPTSQRDQRLVFLFCSSARVMPIDPRHYSRLYARYRVCLDVDVPIIVDEGKVADAQSRLIALGTGPDGLPLNEEDPYADCTATTAPTNALTNEKKQMLQSRYYTATNEAQTHRASNPYKTTNVGNAAFVHSVMVAATGTSGALLTDPSNNSNGSLLQSFLTLNKTTANNNTLTPTSAVNTSTERKSPKSNSKPAAPSAQPANVLFESMFNADKHFVSNVGGQGNFLVTKVASNPPSPTRAGERVVTVKAVMEHVTTTENYLRGAINSRVAMGERKNGKSRPMSGAAKRTDSTIDSSLVSRQGSVSSTLSSYHGSPRKPTGAIATAIFNDNGGDTSAVTSSRKAQGKASGVAIMIPRPKILLGMNPQGTKKVVEATIRQVGIKQCRAAYLDTVPEKHLTDAEKAELLCLKFEALTTGQPQVTKAGTSGEISGNINVNRPPPIAYNNPTSDPMEVLSEADLIKASFLRCARDHLMSVVYDSYGHYDQYRAQLMRGNAAYMDENLNNEDPIGLFTFYLSPSIETSFGGTFVKKREFRELVGDEFANSTNEGVSDSDDTSDGERNQGEHSHPQMSFSNLLDKYHPLKKHVHAQATLNRGKKKMDRRKVRLPPLCAPIEALFAVYLSRLQKFISEDRQRNFTRNLPSGNNDTETSLCYDTFLSAPTEDERVLVDGDVTLELVKLDAETAKSQDGNVLMRDNTKSQQRVSATERRNHSEEYSDDAGFESASDGNSEEQEAFSKSPHGPKSTQPNARTCTDFFADLVLKSKATELPKATSKTTTPPLGPSTSFTPKNRSFSNQPDENNKKTGSKSATVIAPRDHESTALISLTSLNGGNVSTTSTATPATANGYINLNTIFKDSITKGNNASAQTATASSFPRCRFGLTQWLRQYYSWDPAAMADSDEVIEVQLHPTDLGKEFLNQKKLLSGDSSAPTTAAVSECHKDMVLTTQNDSDSDFSDIGEASPAKETQHPPKGPLAEDEIQALYSSRQAQKEAQLMEKKTHRNREKLSQLSRRLPQQLHQYVLSFISELRAEFGDVNGDEEDF